MTNKFATAPLRRTQHILLQGDPWHMYFSAMRVESKMPVPDAGSSGNIACPCLLIASCPNVHLMVPSANFSSFLHSSVVDGVGGRRTD